MAQHDASVRAIAYALLANAGIAVAKSWAAWQSGSGSMLAEAIHSWADAGNQVLLFVGIRQSARPADREHPLGYGKQSYFWSFIVALLLFSAGGLFSVYEGVSKLLHPHPLGAIGPSLAVLALALLLEASSLAGALREVRTLRGDRSVADWLRTTRNAELVVVLGEDSAALVGLALAFVFLGLTWLTGDLRWDGFGSIAIGIVLVVVALFIVQRIRMLLVGRSAEPELDALIRRIIAEDPAIIRLLNAITLQFGPRIMLAVKIEMRPDLTIGEAVEHINALERRLKGRIPELGWCFVEPDLHD